MQNNSSSTSGTSSNKTQYLIASMTIGAALIVCALIVSHTALKVKSLGQSISVTGAAFKPITSNYGIWSGTVSVTEPTLSVAYATITKDMQVARAFLNEEGYPDSSQKLSSVRIRRREDRNGTPLSYSLSQTITIASDDVTRIATLANNASGLIERGLELNSSNPRYLFTGLDSLKLQMIRAATENATLRAKQIAESTGRTVGSPVNARVGVFQIRPLHSQSVSARGISDASSIEKEIVSTVHMSFLIE